LRSTIREWAVPRLPCEQSLALANRRSARTSCETYRCRRSAQIWDSGGLQQRLPSVGRRRIWVVNADEKSIKPDGPATTRHRSFTEINVLDRFQADTNTSSVLAVKVYCACSFLHRLACESALRFWSDRKYRCRASIGVATVISRCPGAMPLRSLVTSPRHPLVSSGYCGPASVFPYLGLHLECLTGNHQVTLEMPPTDRSRSALPPPRQTEWAISNFQTSSPLLDITDATASRSRALESSDMPFRAFMICSAPEPRSARDGRPRTDSSTADPSSASPKRGQYRTGIACLKTECSTSSTARRSTTRSATHGRPARTTKAFAGISIVAGSSPPELKSPSVVTPRGWLSAHLGRSGRPLWFRC
jgi:hypothetical protein